MRSGTRGGSGTCRRARRRTRRARPRRARARGPAAPELPRLAYVISRPQIACTSCGSPIPAGSFVPGSSVEEHARHRRPAVAVAGRRKGLLDADPQPAAGDGQRLRRGSEVDRLRDAVRARVDARHGPREAVGHPHGTGADRDAGGQLADRDLGLDRARVRIDPRHRAVAAVRDPDRALARGDRSGPVAERDRVRHRGGPWRSRSGSRCCRCCRRPRPRPRRPPTRPGRCRHRRVRLTRLLRRVDP